MRNIRNRHMAVLLQTVLDAHVKGQTLDAGCGDGEAARWLAKQGYDVIATDPEIPHGLDETHERIGSGSVLTYSTPCRHGKAMI